MCARRLPEDPDFEPSTGTGFPVFPGQPTCSSCASLHWCLMPDIAPWSQRPTLGTFAHSLFETWCLCSTVPDPHSTVPFLLKQWETIVTMDSDINRILNVAPNSNHFHSAFPQSHQHTGKTCVHQRSGRGQRFPHWDTTHLQKYRKT